MADKKISAMADASALTGDEVMPLIQGGVNVKGSIKKVLQAFTIVDCGEWAASNNLFPTTGGTGLAGIIEKGNEFAITGEGTLGETEIYEGNKYNLRALDDAPGQNEDKWKIY